jgi:MFS transporter, DHA1 family, inner membrane transport protein
MSSASHPQTAAKERAILLTLAAVQFTHILDFMIMMPLGPQLMRAFAITPGQFGRLVAAYGLAAAITGFAGGFVLDRFERKRALVILYFGFGLATLACALAPNHHTLFMGRLAAGAFGGVANSVILAMVGDVIPPARRGRGMAFVMSAFPLASIVGVPLGLVLAGEFEWHAPFFLLAALSVPILALAIWVLPRLRVQHVPQHPWKQMSAILSHPIHQRALLLSAMLVFAGGAIVPYFAPSLVANIGVKESQLPWIYVAGGIATLAATPWIGRLSDRCDKLHVLSWLSLGAAVVTLVLTNLSPAPLGVAMLITATFMVTMSGRFSPTMAMITNAVDGRYRGGFMSVNSALQQAASGLANLTASALVTSGAGGRLVGYPRVGLVAVVCFGLTVFLAARLRAAAPHAAKPGSPEAVPAAVLD